MWEPPTGLRQAANYTPPRDNTNTTLWAVRQITFWLVVKLPDWTGASYKCWTMQPTPAFQRPFAQPNNRNSDCNTSVWRIPPLIWHFSQKFQIHWEQHATCVLELCACCRLWRSVLLNHPCTLAIDRARRTCVCRIARSDVNGYAKHYNIDHSWRKAPLIA